MKLHQTLSNRLGMLVVVATIILLLALVPKSAFATDRYWSGESGGSWNIDQDGNWFNTHPSSGDDLTFNNTGNDCGTSGIKTPYCNYGAGAYFGNITAFNCSGGITWEGDQTYALKFENQDSATFTSQATLANRTSPDNDLQINPVNGPITVNNVIISNNKWLYVYGGNTLNVNGVISQNNGTASLVCGANNPSTVILNAFNTFSGATYVLNGTLRTTVSGALASSAVTLGDTSGSAGAAVNLDGGLTWNGQSITVRSGSSGTLTIANTSGTSGTATYNNNVTLNRAVTFYANTSGSLTFSGSTLDLQGNTLTVDGGGGSTVSSTLQNSTGTGSLVKTGIGTLTLSGANTYSGGTTINAGQLTINGASSGTSGPLGPNTASVYLGDTTGGASATLAYSGVSTTYAYPITVQSGSTGTKTLTNASSVPLVYSGSVILNDSLTLDPGSATGSINLSGAVTGSGGIIKVNSSKATFSTTSSANQYAGNTTISQGVLQLGSGTAIPNGSGKGIVTLNPTSPNTATFDLDGNNQTINGLISSGTGSAVVDDTSSASVTLTVGTSGSNPSGTFSGVIQNSSSGTLGLTKAGSGTLTLGGVNTFTGNTTVSAGKLALSGSGSIANSPQISIATGAALDVSAITPSGYSLNVSGTLALNINKTGSTLTQGQLVLGAKNLTYVGSLTVTASGSTLATGDGFILITNTGSKSGWFGSVNLPLLASGISWDTNKLATSGVLDIYTFTTTALALSTPTNTAATISALKLANHANSGRGTPVATSAAGTSHGTATVTSGALTYTPTSGYSGSDSFTVTFQDGHGWQTMAVSVTVGNGTGQSPNYLTSGTTNISSVNYFYVNFAGIPGDTYTVETNSLGSGASWTKWGNITASSTGAMQVLDPVGSGSLFYRTVYPAY